MFLLTLGLMQWASAFTILYFDNGQVASGWDLNVLEVRVNLTECSIDSTKLSSMIEEAMDLWNSVPTNGLELVLGASTDTTAATALAAEAPESAIIVCSNNFSGVTGKNASNIPATTKPAINVNSGRMVYGAILLNSEAGAAADIASFDEEKVRIILAHELGHVLGLGHTEVEHSLMFFSAAKRTTMSLSQDDADGVSYLYPRQELGDAPPFGCSASNFQPLGPRVRAQMGLEFLLLLGMVLGFWRRRRGG